MPRIFIHLEADCLQVNLMSTSAQINQLKYTILYYTILNTSWRQTRWLDTPARVCDLFTSEYSSQDDPIYRQILQPG